MCIRDRPTPCKKRECPLLNPVPTLIGTTANEASWLVYTQRSDFDAKYFWNLAQRVDIDQAQLIGGFSTYWFKLKNAVYNHLVDNAIDKISDRVTDSGQRWNVSPHLLSAIKDAGQSPVIDGRLEND